MIRLNQLSMHYMLGESRIDILHEVNLEITAGERVACIEIYYRIRDRSPRTIRTSTGSSSLLHSATTQIQP